MKTLPGLSKKRHIVNILIFVLFFSFAVLQLNDPDPALWCLIYGATAGTALISSYVKIPKVILFVVLLALLGYGFQFFPYLLDWLQTEDKNEIFGEMVYSKPYLEGTREFLGLLMSAMAIVYVMRA